MEFKEYQERGTVVFELSGNLLGDTDGLPFLESVTNYVSQKKKSFIVDLGKLQHMNSSGLGMLITAMNKVRTGGGDMVVVNPSEAIAKLFIITKLNSIFTILPSVEDGLKKLSPVNT